MGKNKIQNNMTMKMNISIYGVSVNKKLKIWRIVNTYFEFTPLQQLYEKGYISGRNGTFISCNHVNQWKIIFFKDIFLKY